eukprot:MONOS_2591.1-p1 / transcript=MONOS_2591.1 / gene=MONOS_2591 / organism=Monocercomonoides_exilis_PA203 / gene_product=unspecified product / transcript_product=unspecified product / location=Mono_scaffold00054:113081-113947(+) / protein_length=267 / sequence_SO=supercontig / SO=protein_coding / is_pseudo=false
MALLSLISIYKFNDKGRELFLDEIKDIIKYHQEHCNLTRLAYQSIWKFLMERLYSQRELEGVIENELHFAREATREMEELVECVNWKRKEEEGEKEMKDVIVLRRWLDEVNNYLCSSPSWKEKHIELVGGVVQVFHAAKDNRPAIRDKCIYSFGTAVRKRDVNVDILLRKGVVDAVLEILQATLTDYVLANCICFLGELCKRLNGKMGVMFYEARRIETKRKVFERTEEEGYEDIIMSYHEILPDLEEKFEFLQMSKYSSDYLLSL